MDSENKSDMKTIKMEIPERYEDTVGYLINALEEIQNNPNNGYPDEEIIRIKKIEEEISISSEAISNNIRKMAKNMQKGIEAFLNYSKSISHPVIAKLQNVSQKGWYISPNTFSRLTMSELDQMLSESSLIAFETMLMKKSKRNVSDSLNRCSETFPKKAHLFKEIQLLFEKELFSSVILLSYSMADSMCNSTWGFGFFDKDKATGYNLKMFNQFEDMEKSMSSLIKDQLSIEKNEITQYSKHADFQDPIKRKKSFNRHLIIHGHSLEYGTKKNAVRAIYLLDFIEYFSQLDNRKIVG